tara:strand:- start:2485 stop:2730 length:246 start_codon:yes stop_codon:yes gene_type:complete
MNLELKIYVVSSLLQELLDETDSDTRYKYRLKQSINRLQKDLDQMLDLEIDTDVLSLYLSNAGQALEDSLDIEELNQNKDE